MAPVSGHVQAHHLPAADSLFKRYQTEMILATAHEDGSFEDMLKDLSVQVTSRAAHTVGSCAL